ncbi:MAG: hypothetical protein IJD28_02400 [Deferribacterales bacterium]|nr:hypothetical protein [Deferribacterales bacterium]
MKKFLTVLFLFFIISPFAKASTIIDTDGSYAVTALTTSADVLLMGHFDGKIRVFDPFTSKLIKELQGHTKPIVSISADIFGRYALSSSQDGSLIFWDIKQGKMIKRIFKPGMVFRACALEPSAKYALAAFASTVYVWDTSTWENVAIWERIDGGVYSISVEERGLVAAMGGKDGKINLYSLPHGNHIKTLKAGSHIVSSTAFALNSGLLISGGYDKTARVWNINSGTVIKEFSRHTDTVRAVAAAAGGKFFATAGDDGLVALWNISGSADNYSPLGTLPSTALALDPALRFMASGKGAIFQDNKYATLWFPSDRRQSRNIYVFSDALAVLSNLGYVDGSGSFASYITIQEKGRNYTLSQVAKKYNRPERLKITVTKGYISKKIKPSQITQKSSATLLAPISQ